LLCPHTWWKSNATYLQVRGIRAKKKKKKKKNQWETLGQHYLQAYSSSEEAMQRLYALHLEEGIL